MSDNDGKDDQKYPHHSLLQDYVDKTAVLITILTRCSQPNQHHESQFLPSAAQKAYFAGLALSKVDDKTKKDTSAILLQALLKHCAQLHK